MFPLRRLTDQVYSTERGFVLTLITWKGGLVLVLSRDQGERILIGDDVIVTVVRIGPEGVRLGIDAPRDKLILREELVSEVPPEFVRD